MSPGRTAKAARKSYHHGDLHRALLDAAVALVDETKNWEFSLREVARRANVSHNAPYNHFSDKRDLLLAVAAEGYRQLSDQLLRSTARSDGAKEALLASGRAYVHFGLKHPALYRLMFGSVLVPSANERPESLQQASDDAKRVLQGIILSGIETGAFKVSIPVKADHVVLAAWAQVHGLTMLLIDGLHVHSNERVEVLIEKSCEILLRGLGTGDD